MSTSAKRVGELLETYAAMSDPDSGPGVTRLSYTPLERDAHDFFRDRLESLGLTVTVDPVGNTIAELPGSDPSLPAIGTGSHLDSVPNAGAFDGIVGVVGAMVAAETLAAGERLRHPVRFVVFTAEEGARWGQACSGSRMCAGQLDRGRLDTLTDKDGITLAEAMRDLDLDPDRVGEAAWPPEEWAAFVELHIEQGASLDALGVQIGLVDVISGSSRLQITLTGRASHTGGTPMHLRADAAAGAAEIVLTAEALANSAPHRGTRMTASRLDVFPNSITTIPGVVTLQVDVRDVDDLRQREAADELVDRAVAIAEARGLGIEVGVLGDVSPTLLPIPIRDVTAAAAAEAGASYRVMPSGASHDSQVINSVCPAGMIFVPSLNHGVSHAPEELSRYEDIALGVDVLIGSIRRLDAAI
ncbi:MAG: Zn-dependent hydrolase [Actinomycetaceae bacterium]